MLLIGFWSRKLNHDGAKEPSLLDQSLHIFQPYFMCGDMTFRGFLSSQFCLFNYNHISQSQETL